MAEADGLIALCPAAAVPEGRSRRVLVGRHAVAVFNVAGRFHVTDDTCTHGFSSLADGDLEGCIVTCSWHGGAFDVTTGQAVGPPCELPLNVYRCEVHDAEVRADLFEPIVVKPEGEAACPASNK
jgi:nitrite reductase/ring-hydroxylating ferredoxin subunit